MESYLDEVKQSLYHPVVVIGMRRGANVRVQAYQVRSRWELYYTLFWANIYDNDGSVRPPMDEIAYLNIVGEGASNANGSLLIGHGESDQQAVTGRFTADPGFENTALLAEEHVRLMRDLGIEGFVTFEDLVKYSFASNAIIDLTFCYSAGSQENINSIGHTFKELLPNATIHGWTGPILCWPTDTTGEEWIVMPQPWPPWPWMSKHVEITL